MLNGLTTPYRNENSRIVMLKKPTVVRLTEPTKMRYIHINHKTRRGFLIWNIIDLCMHMCIYVCTTILQWGEFSDKLHCILLMLWVCIVPCMSVCFNWIPVFVHEEYKKKKKKTLRNALFDTGSFCSVPLYINLPWRRTC